MRVSPVLLTLVLVAASTLAGCTQDEEDPQASTSASTTTAASTTSASGTTTAAVHPAGNQSAPAAPNQTPTGTLELQVNGTLATFNLTGSDADNDTLTWTLSFGDNSTNETGTVLPAMVNHTYLAGTYTAWFTLSDGNFTKQYGANVTIDTATAAGESVVFTGTVVGPDPIATSGGFCGTDILLGAGTANNAGNSFGVQAKWVGWTYTITPESLLVTFFTGGAFVSGHGGTVPPGASQVAVCADEADVAADFTLTLTPA